MRITVFSPRLNGFVIKNNRMVKTYVIRLKRYRFNSLRYPAAFEA